MAEGGQSAKCNKDNGGGGGGLDSFGLLNNCENNVCIILPERLFRNIHSDGML